MVRKKPSKWFEDENIWRITVKGKIYIGKKYTLKKTERPTLSYQLKKIKDTQLVGQKKKTPLGLLSYKCKKVLNTK